MCCSWASNAVIGQKLQSLLSVRRLLTKWSNVSPDSCRLVASMSTENISFWGFIYVAFRTSIDCVRQVVRSTRLLMGRPDLSECRTSMKFVNVSRQCFQHLSAESLSGSVVNRSGHINCSILN